MSYFINLPGTLLLKKGWVQVLKNLTTALFLFVSLYGFSQTNPTAQSLPYFEDFSGLLYTSTAYPAGIQGWQLSTGGALTSFRTTTPSADLSLSASSGASLSTGGIHNYNGKIGLLATGGVDPSICFAVNTTGLNSIYVSYNIMTIRNPYDGGSNTRINEVTLQYRIGTTGSFINLANMEYQNNTTTQTGSGVTTPQNSVSRSVTLPSGCNNQSVVQLRLAQRDVTGGGSRPSFAIDNINVTGNALTDIFINANNTAVTESFDNFLGDDATTLPTGWSASFTGTATFKGAGLGNSLGGVWAYGSSSSDYALGALRSGTPGDITLTATFRNNTGGTIRNLEIQYDFEQWRFANTSGFTVTSSGTGTGSVASLSQNGTTSGTAGAPTAKALTITGLNVPNNNTFALSWTTTDDAGSDNGIAIDNFSIKANVPLPVLYYQSVASGSWQTVGTWQSSPDNSTWSAASYVPASFANTIYIRNGTTVDMDDNLDIDQVVIESGGTLVRKASKLITLNNGTGDDVTVYGDLKFQSTTSDDYASAVAYSSGSKILVKNGGMIETTATSSNYWDLAAQSVVDGYIEYEDGGIFNWNATISFSSSGITYFPGVSSTVKPVFRVSKTPSLGVGSASATTINGIFEPTVAITWNSAGTKTFRNGIRGAGDITQASGCGQFIISGTNAELGGAGLLVLDVNGLSIPNGADATLVSSKTIDSGPIGIAGTFDLSDKVLNGTHSQFTVSGTAIVKTGHANGLLSGGSLQGTVAPYNFNVSNTTVVYNRIGAQTVTNNDYYNLLFNGSGNKQLSGNTIVNGDISWLDNNGVSTVKCGSYTLEVRGNWINDSASDFDYGTGTVYLGQTNNSISGSNSFNILKIFGTVTLASGTQLIYDRIEVPIGAILNTNGNLTLQSSASLLHGINTTSGGGSVSGNIIVKRTGSTGIKYNYWSAPVSGALSATLGGSKQYYYNPTSATDLTPYGLKQGWVTTSGTMTNALGYISQGGGTVSFSGPANDGTRRVAIKMNVGTSNDVPWNLVGNPYPCSISADAFMTVNGPLGSNLILGSLYFWDDDGSGGPDWDATYDYGIWSGAGFIGPNSFKNFTGNIASGQSFFVKKLNNGTDSIEFRNTMRGASNDVFFRQKPIERFWINMINPNRLYNETLIAFIDDATDSMDLMYDAPKLKGNADLSLYTVLNNENYAIQAFSELTQDRIISLGLDAGTAGTHLLRLKKMENLDETVTIILEDRDLNYFQNLNQDPEYEFYTTAADDISRFYLHVNPAVQISTSAASCGGGDAEISLIQPGNKTWDYVFYDKGDEPITSGNGFNGSLSFSGLVAGTYRIELVDQYGFAVSKVITVDGKLNVKADFVPSTTMTLADQLVHFGNNSAGATSFEWDFGDGTTLAGISEPYHAYSEEGLYQVTLSASNDDCGDEIIKEIYVYKITTGIQGQREDKVYVTTIGEHILIRFDYASEKPVELTVHNVLGQKLYDAATITSGDKQIDLTGTQGQYYFLTINDGNKALTTKVILLKD